MKKVLLLALLCLSVTAKAQTWSATHHQSDELKEMEAYSSYMFQNPAVGMFLFWSNEQNTFRIKTYSGTFDIKNGGVMATIGLYDSDDQLVDKFNIWLDCPKESDGDVVEVNKRGTSILAPAGQKRKAKKVLQYIKGNAGYVRILAPMHRADDFDLKVFPIG